jgi:nucleoside-triphosphatase
MHVQCVIVQIFVTGCPGVGKTTACIKAIELLRQRGVRCGGVVSREVREVGTRTGFEFVDVGTGETFPLASTSGHGPLVGKYHVDLAGIARTVAILRDIKTDVIFIDEFGPMELKSRDFQAVVDDLVHSNKNIVIVVHNRLAAGYKCIEITAGNRDELPAKIAANFCRE